MASLTIIPYTPAPTKAHYCAEKDASEPTDDRGKKHQIKLSTLPTDTPQLQPTAVAGNAADIATRDDELPLGWRMSSVSAFVQSQNHARGQQYLDRGSSVDGDEFGEDSDLDIDSLYKDSGDTEPTTETESNSGNLTIWDGVAETEARGIGSGIRDTEIGRQPLKRKARTGGQGSQVNPWVIPDSDTESEGDIESWDRLAWKKQKVRPGSRTIDDIDDETDGAEFGIGIARIKDDTQSESNSASIAGNNEGREQAHSSLVALSPHHLDPFEPDDRVKAQSAARVGGNSEWGIHGIIGKEVIEGRLYYCVDWEPTMILSDELLGAQGLVQEFEVKEQARLRRANNGWKREGRHRKQK